MVMSGSASNRCYRLQTGSQFFTKFLSDILIQMGYPAEVLELAEEA
jgi:hypothetical protein